MAPLQCLGYIMRMRVTNPLNLTKDVLTWVAPAAGIPALRYFQDDKSQRKELFVRDASTYMLGAFLFLGLYHGGKRLLANPFITMSGQAKDVTAFMAALTANILYAGFGAVWLSKRYKSSQVQPPAKMDNYVTQPPKPVYFYKPQNTLSYWA